MKKRAVMILITAVLGLSSVVSPVCYAAAEESAETQEDAGGQGDGENDKNLLDKGAEIGSDLYDKIDEKLDEVDGVSLRRQIKEALEEMDERGISPTAVAEELFGIRPPTASQNNGKKPGDTLIEDAQRTVRKKTEGFFSVLWDGFLDTLESMITTAISVFSSPEGTSAKGGSGL